MEEQLKQLIKTAVMEAIAEAGLTVQQQSDGFPEIMTLDQVSKFVHLSKDYIKNHKDDLCIPHSRKGRAYIFLKSELLEWVAEREETRQTNKVKAAPVKRRGSITRIV